ncbi:autophagy-related protein 7 [Plasmodium falciparum NF54]|uniref:Autophagy-related protein 7, putative n=2 Tax=Plasmodium falciparum TaxID=5833 RepID=Q8IIA3_PLAF7|nr:autophagy-related protein 7, putative [Plasmodium falciparum 3D7]KAF4330916.1 autophagy-related protein 7 [Plasmodium falciparum NF54]PKC49133.1 autophagy-related protein 7 [Plasmodium falciparum NF54]CZT98923.1 autophagy-related protein 7, putative [Plasmodium falciparum 3D7]|eukprot:XP_001347942.1 autophagy-related protein 7, putative [Plasmodium falciparum 3D7]
MKKKFEEENKPSYILKHNNNEFKIDISYFTQLHEHKINIYKLQSNYVNLCSSTYVNKIKLGFKYKLLNRYLIEFAHPFIHVRTIEINKKSFLKYENFDNEDEKNNMEPNDCTKTIENERNHINNINDGNKKVQKIWYIMNNYRNNYLGVLLNFNTLEEFLKCNKDDHINYTLEPLKCYINNEKNDICKDMNLYIHDNIYDDTFWEYKENCLTVLEKINKYVILSFFDLKKYICYYSIANPIIKPKDNYYKLIKNSTRYFFYIDSKYVYINTENRHINIIDIFYLSYKIDDYFNNYKMFLNTNIFLLLKFDNIPLHTMNNQDYYDEYINKLYTNIECEEDQKSKKEFYQINSFYKLFEYLKLNDISQNSYHPMGNKSFNNHYNNNSSMLHKNYDMVILPINALSELKEDIKNSKDKILRYIKKDFFDLYICFIDINYIFNSLSWDFRNLLYCLTLKYKLYDFQIDVLAFRDISLLRQQYVGTFKSQEGFIWSYPKVVMKRGSINNPRNYNDEDKNNDNNNYDDKNNDNNNYDDSHNNNYDDKNNDNNNYDDSHNNNYEDSHNNNYDDSDLHKDIDMDKDKNNSFHYNPINNCLSHQDVSFCSVTKMCKVNYNSIKDCKNDWRDDLTNEYSHDMNPIHEDIEHSSSQYENNMSVNNTYKKDNRNIKHNHNNIYHNHLVKYILNSSLFQVTVPDKVHFIYDNGSNYVDINLNGKKDDSLNKQDIHILEKKKEGDTCIINSYLKSFSDEKKNDCIDVSSNLGFSINIRKEDNHFTTRVKYKDEEMDVLHISEGDENENNMNNATNNNINNNIIKNYKTFCCDNKVYDILCGWKYYEDKKKEKKSIISIINLNDFINKDTIQRISLELNIKLIKWKILKDLKFEHIKKLKILIIGLGTLGCMVARNCVSWGIQHYTFVDNSRVSFSNISRQYLYTLEDAEKYGNIGEYKCVAAKKNLLKICPDLNITAKVMDIPMPGHLNYLNENLEDTINELDNLINNHDVVFLLTDSKESRYFPCLMIAEKQYNSLKELQESVNHNNNNNNNNNSSSSSSGSNKFRKGDNVLCEEENMITHEYIENIKCTKIMDKSLNNILLYEQNNNIYKSLNNIHMYDRYQEIFYNNILTSVKRLCKMPPLGITVAISFDSFVVLRHSYLYFKGACYFCNDMHCPSDSLSYRTLDEKCTVTRCGISNISSSIATELLLALTQHPLYFFAPHIDRDQYIYNYDNDMNQKKNSDISNIFTSCLGATPHIMNFNLANFTIKKIFCEPFEKCMCCSERVILKYQEDKMDFIRNVIRDSSILERITNMDQLKVEENDVIILE